MYTVKNFRDTFAGWTPDIQGASGHFSVVVLIADIDGEAHVLYEVRARDMETQPGEVCFPGGRIEDCETPEEAAIREMREEIGLSAEEVHIIAQLDTFHPASGIVIYPFLAEVPREVLSGIQPNPAEVEEVFLVPVSFLEQEPYRYAYSLQMDLTDLDYSRIGITDSNYHWRPMKAEIISWDYQGRYIWGLTAQITKHTMAILSKDG